MHILFVSPGHYGKENMRSGGQDMHNFISSGFVTLGRGHLKGKVKIKFEKKKNDCKATLSC